MLKEDLEFRNVPITLAVLHPIVNKIEETEILLPFLAHSNENDHWTVNEHRILTIDKEHTFLLRIRYLLIMLQIRYVVHGIYDVACIGIIDRHIFQIQFIEKQIDLCRLLPLRDGITDLSISHVADTIHRRKNEFRPLVLTEHGILFHQIFIEFGTYVSPIGRDQFPHLRYFDGLKG